MQIIPAPYVTLPNGVKMPQLGLGTWPMSDAEAMISVEAALNMGYRLIDTAEIYANERGVGAGIRRSAVSRDEIFITSKFNRQWHSIEGVRTACELSLKRLEVDYLDLLLVHWPNPDQDRYVEAFAGLERLLETGLVRAIGTSNFKPAHLQRLFDQGMTPHINQIQLDPYHLRADLVSLHRAKGIITESWGPLGRGRTPLLADPVVTQIAAQHACAPSQVVLRWHTQQDFVTTPKSSYPPRMAENLDSFRITLSEHDMQQLNALDRPDPDMQDADHFGN